MNYSTSEDSMVVLQEYLDDNLVPYKKDFILKYETYFKTGGSAGFYIMPVCVKGFVDVVLYLRENNIAYKVVGLTTNVFFLDELDYGVIITTKNLAGCVVDGNKIEMDCGYALYDFVRVALIHGLGGVEGLEGVPGSLGGGIAMNAGAYGYTISDHLLRVTCIDPAGDILILDKDQCGFSFRNSIFKGDSNYVILSAVFELLPAVRRESADRIETYHIARHSYQEFAFPNLGSMFSVRGDFYREIFNGNPWYKFFCYVLKLVFKNPVSKFISRKKPNNKVFNWLAKVYLSTDDLVYQPSPKSMNILINDGVSSLDDALSYIDLIRGKLSKDTLIENEIIVSPLRAGAATNESVLGKVCSKEYV